jgi:simple sugar transport system substrate-binding protein
MASQIDGWIKSGNIGEGIVYQEEIIVDTDTITDEIIEKYGINPDPGKGVITR